jgi:hypothetical protein
VQAVCWSFRDSATIGSSSSSRVRAQAPLLVLQLILLNGKVSKALCHLIDITFCVDGAR